ncbi:MAG TPA: CHASE3 domain-containing protein, partial [Anaerolineales bacterium]|nr:CHASE3 domain-containing protein [Anaerolineales bacterium]
MKNLSATSSTQNRSRLQTYINAFQDLKIGQKISVGNIVTIVLMIVITAVVLINLNALTADFNFLVEHDQPVLSNAALLEKLTVDMETGLRGFVITGKDEFLEPYFSGNEAFDQLLEEEKVLVSDNPPQVARLDEILRLHDEWLIQAAEPEIAKRREVNQASVTSETLQETLRGGVGKGILDELRGV